LVAPEAVLHERLIVPVPQDPVVADNPVGVAGIAGATETFVQPPQLLLSSLSVIDPDESALVLSAHARIEYVPEEAKVCETLAVLVPPAASVAIEDEARSVTVPPPFAAVETWKKLENDAPVDAAPTFEIVDENVCATPAVAVLGVGAAAVRSGWVVTVPPQKSTGTNITVPEKFAFTAPVPPNAEPFTVPRDPDVICVSKSYH
jgi:hypothetical protein